MTDIHDADGLVDRALELWGRFNREQRLDACRLLRANGLGEIADDLSPVLVPDDERFDGPGLYEFRLANGTQPVAFLDRAPERDGVLIGKVYRWRHYWRGKYQGRGHYVPEAGIRIIRKLEGFDA